MMSRTQRLFGILFHVIVFHIPQNNYFSNYAGMIIGVHPTPISLESLELDEHGLVGFMNKMMMLSTSLNAVPRRNLLAEPFWIQDSIDGKCLGPTGSFSDCGDATLWFIRAKKDRKRRKGNSNNSLIKGVQNVLRFFSTSASKENKGEEEQEFNWRFALQLSNQDMSAMSSSSQSLHITEENKDNAHLSDEKGGECLMVYKNRKNEKDCVDSNCNLNSEFSFRLQSCKKDTAWNWNVNGEGYLMSMPNKKQKSATPNVCIWRDWNSTNTPTMSSSTLVAPCGFDGKTEDRTNFNAQYRQVSFSMVRLQQASIASSSVPSSPIDIEIESLSSSSSKGNKIESYSAIPATTIAVKPRVKIHPHHKSRDEQIKASETVCNVPHTMTTSESHAHASLHHLELLPMNSLRIPPDTAADLLTGGNPLLLNFKEAGAVNKKPNFKNLSNNRHSLGATIKSRNSDINLAGTTSRLESNIIHSKQNRGGISSHHSIKMPSHPYITESKGTGKWTDTSTDLQYPTDLVSFLGNDRKTHGRHTLMGVGQYTRTVFKVKIYGVAFYVSKRDVLADPKFSKYSTYTSEELQNSDEFYKHLCSPPTSEPASFDRTLMIKLNMQLGVETIRTCLQSEWKLLTEEHKNMLIGSSLKTRDADQEMLDIIKDEDNSSNCSCGQTAPEEYEADPSCCARGTEMVFTWRKDGTLELRMNRRFTDTYPSEVAQGIFYEYLRVDDPMSVEARLNFADGFPFLLAPLAQVKGVVVGGKSSHSGTGNVGSDSHLWNTKNDNYDDRDQQTKPKKTNPFLVDIGHTIIKKSASIVVGTVSSVCHVAQTGLGIIQEAGTGLHRQVSTLLTAKYQPNKQQLSILTPTIKNKIKGTNIHHHTPLSSLAVDVPYIDEIAVNMPPTNSFTHKLFLYAVHLYLLLLLVISLPESYNIKTIRMVTSSKEMKISPNKKNNSTNTINRNTNSDINDTATNSGDVSPSPIIKVVRTSFSRNSSFRDSFAMMPIIEEAEDEDDKVDGIFYEDSSSNHESSNNQIKKSLSYFLHQKANAAQ